MWYVASSDKRTYVREYSYLGGGAYVQFRMDRIMNQPAIDMKELTKEEVELCRRIMQGV